MVGTKEERLAVLDELYPVWEPDTLWTRFRKSAGRFPQKEYFLLETESYTYAQTLIHVNKVARSLYGLGVRPGDHVAVMLRNCAEFVFLTYAIAKLGAVKIPVNAVICQTELEHILKKSDAKFFICGSIPSGGLSEITGIEKVVFVEGSPGDDSDICMSWNDFCAIARCVPEDVVEKTAQGCFDPQGLAEIMFTSGSTNESKGVMLTHDMLLRSSYANCYTRRFELGRRIYAPLPLFHAYSYIEGLLALVYVGGALITSKAKFTAQHALQMMRDFRANDMLLLGSLILKMLVECDPQPEDYPDLHAGYYCTSTPDWMWEASQKAFGVQDITTGMGMTELTSSGVMVRPNEPVDSLIRYDGRPKAAGSAGSPLYNGGLLTIKICDPQTELPLPPDTVGEIYYQGLVVTKGYYQNPEANQYAYTQDGWFKSGDLGRLSSDGYLKFVGRKNDMYKINGENVSPMFLDSVIQQCPLVNAVETVGVAHPKYGEVGVAFIDAKDSSPETRQEIEAYCRDNLAKFQVPKYYFYSDSAEWPRTGTGKLSKALLRSYAEKQLAVPMV